MAIPSTPQFRSLSQILGEMVTTFLSELDRRGVAPGIASLKPGSPYLAAFAAVAQSQMRNQEQTLSVLDANDIDIAHGDRLDSIGNSENVPRRGATFAAGVVTLSDTSFAKVFAKVYQGQPAPIPGSILVYITDGTSFPATGQVYVGRGTTNYEGPLTYTSVVNSGGYWTMTLVGGTTNFHGLGETVVLAQGGNRLVSAGQVVSTSQGNQVQAATFVTTSDVTLQDGENSLAGVPVTCQTPGIIGNVAVGSIKVVPSPAFTGMAVTNLSPISNGQDVENDDHYRERIRTARRNRARATPLALISAAYGVKAPDASATVTSAQYVARASLPDQLVIDDGTGYEETDSGIALEVLMDSAIGGETRFYLVHGRPVAKATAVTILSAPFPLANAQVLTVKVGGAESFHSFNSADFFDITNATAYEVVSSINANFVLPYSARTAAGGTKVAIFAKAETLDDIQVVSAGANAGLLFPTARIDTLRLYKNDLLLSKDGQGASITGLAQSAWVGITSGDTLTISVDGTPFQTYIVTDADFVALNLGPIAVAPTNPLSTWAALFNALVPGITSTILGSALVFTSNLGLSARASVVIDPDRSTLVSKGMFNPLDLSAAGRNRDYTLDRFHGFIELANPLLAGDTLTVGSNFTRAYIQSGDVSSGATVVNNAFWWFAADGNAKVVSNTLTAAHKVNVSWNQLYPIRRYQAQAIVGSTPFAAFTNVKQGDWVFFSADMWFTAPFITLYAYRVCNVDVFGTWFEVEDAPGAPSGNGDSDASFDAFKYIAFSRTSANVSIVDLGGGVYTEGTLFSQFVSRLTLGINNCRPASMLVELVDHHIRLTTDTYGLNGDIACLAQSPDAALVGFSVVDAVQNDTPEAASIETDNSDVGTPIISDVKDLTDAQNLGVWQIKPTDITNLANKGRIVGGFFLRPLPTATLHGRYSTLSGVDFSWEEHSAPWVAIDYIGQTPVTTASGYTDTSVDNYIPVNRYHVGPLSTLNVVFDSDPVSKGYSVQMSRHLVVDPSVPYGQGIQLFDADNANSTLGVSFGAAGAFDFKDFVLHAHARTPVWVTGDQANTQALFRKKDWRAAPTDAVLAILAPTVPSASQSFINQVGYIGSLKGDGSVLITMQSTVEIALPNIDTSARLLKSSAGVTDTIVSAFVVTDIVRAAPAGSVVVTFTMPNADVTDHKWQINDVIYLNSALVNFPPGFKVVTARTANTITYTDGAGAADHVVAPATTWMAWTTQPVDFSLAVVNNYFSVWCDAYYWSVADPWARTRTSARISDVSVDPNGIFWIKVARRFSTAAASWVIISTF